MHPASNLNPTPTPPTPPTPDSPSTPPAPTVVPTPHASTTRQRRMVPRWAAITTGVAGLALGATLLGGAAFAQTPTATDGDGTVDLPYTSSSATQGYGFGAWRSFTVDGSAEGGTTEARPAFRDMGMGRVMLHAMRLDTIAETLGLTTDDLAAQLAEGTALTDIITAQGSTVAEVVDALMVEAQEAFDLAVSEGHLTQEQADERLAALPAELTERIESGFVLHHGGPGGSGGFGRDCAPGADGGSSDGGENATPDATTPDSGTDEDATPTTS